MKSENEVYNEPNTNFKGELAFKNVSFAYPNTEKEILKNISFNVKQGEFIGIIGQSGIGKSTIFELLVGFYNNYTGNIYIDDVEIRKLPLEYIRENITLVSQNPFLFAGTLRDNFYAVNPGAAEEDIFKAINLANISSLINSLPNGLDTYIGENGTKLSGGEKQRIYLSMALLRKSKILLLDEITSSVDTESEDLIRNTLEKLANEKNMIVIAITHRDSLIKNASKIFELKDNKINIIINNAH